MNQKLLYTILGLISVVYLLNPTLGVFEFIPDNIPFIGNLDELAASALLIKAIRILFGKEKASKDDSVIDDELLKK